MNCETGEIIDPESWEETMKGFAKGKGDQSKFVEMKLEPTPEQKLKGKVGRNDPCPCGSELKFKKCHLIK